MTGPAHILCIGTDALLLQTRRAVLQTEFLVTAISSLEELALLSPAQPFDIALLCHTLTEAECRSAAGMFRRRWPQGRTVVLTTYFTPSFSTELGRTISSHTGPAALLRELRCTLNTPHFQQTSYTRDLHFAVFAGLPN